MVRFRPNGGLPVPAQTYGTGYGRRSGFRLRRPYSPPIRPTDPPNLDAGAASTASAPQTGTLDRAVSLRTTNGFGTGQVQLGPSGQFETWHVTTIAISATDLSSATPWSVSCATYSGVPIAGNLIANTYDGTGDSTDTDVTLVAGQYITAVWFNPTGLQTATLTMSLYGTVQIGGAPYAVQ